MAQSKLEVIISSPEDPYFATRILPIRIRFLRSFLPQHSLDVPLVIKAEILEFITGDDIILFGFFHDLHTQDMLKQTQENFLLRINTEIETPETPPIIRKKLQAIRRVVKSSDWRDKAQYEKTKRLWMKNVLTFTKNKINTYAPFDEAINYKQAHQDIIREGWLNYLASHGRIP